MSDSSIKNYLEQSMLVIGILAFSWPIAAFLLLLLASLFGGSLQIHSSFWKDAYLFLVTGLAATCLYWMGRTIVLAFLKTGFRRQLLTPVAMTIVFLCSFFPLGLVIAVMGAAAFEA